MRIGFLINQIDNRGTGNALYDYAHYNETILGNESLIFSADNAPVDPLMEVKMRERFTLIHSAWRLGTNNYNLDALYHIKSGEDDGYVAPRGVPYLVHAVFNGSQPHGERYATISRWMGDMFDIPHVPHIVRKERATIDIRERYGIPKDATVFGRYGGYDSFDLSWVWDSINDLLEQREDVYFLFMNTANWSKLYDHKRVLWYPATADDGIKAGFIEACDAMLHARSRGETFGIACGEFAIHGKPVFTYANSPEKAHYRHLGDYAIPYSNRIELSYFLNTFRKKKFTYGSLYGSFSPESVMSTFKEVFL